MNPADPLRQLTPELSPTRGVGEMKAVSAARREISKCELIVAVHPCRGDNLCLQMTGERLILIGLS